MNNQNVTQEIRNAIIDEQYEQVVSLLTTNEQLRNAETSFGTWLHVAARHGRLQIARFLVDLGLHINARGGIAGGTPINLAAAQGHLDVVGYLISLGAELDVSEPEKNPLFAAIHGGHTAVAKVLIENGIDTQIKYTGENMKEMDALAFAQDWGRSEIVTLLKSVRGDETNT